MNKKFFSALVMGSLLLGGTVVSCSDYDDDIKNLQEQIDKLAGKSELESEVASLRNSIATAQGAADAAKTAAAAAQAAADAAKSVADGKLDEAAVKAIAEAAAEGAAAAAKEGKDAAAVAQAAADAAKAAADAAQATADKGVTDAAAAQGAADAAAAAAKAVEAKLAEYATKAELKAAAEVAAAAAQAAAKEGKDAAKVAADAAAAAQKTADEAVAAAKKAAEDAEAAKTAGLNSAAEAAEAAKAAQKTANEAVAAAKKAQETADAAKAAGDKAQATADAAQAAADKVAADLKALDTRVAAIETTLKSILTEDGLNKLVALVDQLKEDAAEYTTIVSKRLTSLVFAPNTYIDGIETINFETFNYTNWGTEPNNWLMDKASAVIIDKDNKPAVEVKKEDAEKVGAIEIGGKFYAPSVVKRIGDNNTVAEYLVSPSAGVELSSIESLSFIGNQATNATRAIGKAPIQVVGKSLKDGVLTLKLAKLSAENESLGSGEEEWAEPVESFEIVSLKATLAESVLTEAEKAAGAEVNVFSDWTRLTESVVRPFIANAQSVNRTEKGVLRHDQNGNYTKSHFWKFSAIYDPTMTDGTEDQTKDSPLTWNFVRKSATKGIAKDVVYTDSLNLLDLVTVCAAAQGLDATNELNHDGREVKNYAEYGLSFEFNVMPFNYVNETTSGSTIDETPQEKFAKLDEDGHTLWATSEDGRLKNADAVGRTPVIQAVLKDTVNNTVVDVRYFKINWVETVPSSLLATEETLDAVPYGCETYEAWILQKYMNYLYAETNLSKSVFHKTYTQMHSVAADQRGKFEFFAYTYTYKKNGKDVVVKYNDIAEIQTMLEGKSVEEGDAELAALGLGAVEIRNDGDKNLQSWNLKINVDAQDYRVKHADFDKDFVVEGFVIYESESGAQRIFIPVNFTVKPGRLANKYEYLESQWENGALTVENTMKTRPANPTLISDKEFGDGDFSTTQLISDITYGYMAENKETGKGSTPSTYKELASYLSYPKYGEKGKDVVDAETDVVFDAKRLDEILPALTEASTANFPAVAELFVKNAKKELTAYPAWRVTEDGKVLAISQKVKQANGKFEFEDEDDDLATSEQSIVAARIDNSNGSLDEDVYVYLVDTKAQDGTYGEECDDFDTHETCPTDAALMLVGNKVPVKVTANNGCDDYDFDKYLIRFITPLDIQEATSDLVVKDVLNYGSTTAVAVGNQIKVREAFGSKTPLQLITIPAIYYTSVDEYNEAKGKELTEEEFEKLSDKQKLISGEIAATEDLNNWYGVKNITVDPSMALINLNKSGKYVTNIDDFSLLSDITKKGSDEQLYELNLMMDNAQYDPADETSSKYVEWDENDPGEITGIMYHNNSGQLITRDLIIKVPVMIDTKWQKGVLKYITLTVKENNTK